LFFIYFFIGIVVAVLLETPFSVKKTAVTGGKVMTQGVAFNRLMLEMRSMQAEAMVRKSAPDEASKADAPSFSDMLVQAVNKVNETQQASAQLATAFEMGQSGVDLTDVMIASQKASVSFTAMIQVRNKLAQAYQDIMQMPV
jgi:flagellar hook-basal body complex protein FliE